MTISPTIVLLLVAAAALIVGLLIYVINALEARRADWMVRKAEDVVSREREESRLFAGEKSDRPRLTPRHS
jgi:hypothetical protein